MKKSTMLFSFGILLATFFLTSCMTYNLNSLKHEKAEANTGVIFGYFDINAKDLGYLSAISILNNENFTKFKFYSGIPNDIQYFIVDNAFIAINAKAGQYYIPNCYTRGGNVALQLLPFTFDVKRSQQLIADNSVSVEPNKLSFWGKCTITLNKTGPFQPETISTNMDFIANDKEILRKFLPHLKDTPWEAMVNAYLEE